MIPRILTAGPLPAAVLPPAAEAAVVGVVAGRPIARPNLRLYFVAPTNPAQLRQTMLYLNYVRH